MKECGNPEERNKSDANPFSGDVAEREVVLGVVGGTHDRGGSCYTLSALCVFLSLVK
jgi:hypothetical protein